MNKVLVLILVNLAFQVSELGRPAIEQYFKNDFIKFEA